ncbi:hypothetical protein C8R44DRAFT_753418 [Mycena epipterygia]|nr:hypothetical protein C8R44DRAFT_753418 [Mycena epipterygia]
MSCAVETAASALRVVLGHDPDVRQAASVGGARRDFDGNAAGRPMRQAINNIVLKIHLLHTPSVLPMPAMGFMKLTKREKAQALDTEEYSYVLVDGPSNPHYLKKDKKGQEPLVYVANNRTLIQRLVAAPRLLQFPEGTNAVRRAAGVRRPRTVQFRPGWPRRHHPNFPTQYHAAWEAQGEAWRLEVIPRLVHVFIHLWHKTRGLREADALPPPREIPCNCGAAVSCTVTLVRFTIMEDVRISVCKCAPAAEQLLWAGLFPSAPWRPTLAVDARVLQLVMDLFVRIAPNNTAWSATLETFLEGLGFTLTNEGSLRRLFASCLEWYTHLRHRVDHDLDDILEGIRIDRRIKNVADSDDSEDADGQATPTCGPRELPATPSTARPLPPAQNDENRGRRRRCVVSSSPAHHPSTSPIPAEAPRGTRKRRRDPTPEATSNPFDDPPPRTRPSDYLRRRCPACFGDLTHDPAAVADFFACMDTCFTQRRNKGTHDPPKAHPDTHFIPEDLSAKMEEYVDGVRDTRPGGKRRKATVVAVEEEEDPDNFEHPKLRLPRSVLNGHDRVLLLVNMHSAGEKQFYVLLLMEMMFQHLPLDIVVGFLYDVAYQLERSAWKWNFLGRYMDRLAFAVAVFHAFGHEWSCQIIYHLRKREGFGFTNGEGCKRLWHSISRLIAHLRISSVQHADEANLFKLAEWIHRRALFSKAKRMEAELELTEHAVPFLRAQWAAQVKAQTKPLPRRSKTRGQQTVAAVLALRDAKAIRQARVTESEAAALDAIDAENADAIVHTKVALKSARKALFKVKEQLARKELTLGVADRSELKKLAKSKYMELRMNAQAVKMRLRDRLRKHKFERDRIERSSRRQQVSADYNKLCDAIAKEISKGRAPARAIAPERIESGTLYALDVDDAIWQDMGLLDDDKGVEPPLWLSDDSVRSGICAMLDLDRANEEDIILAKERRSLRAWFAEEWTIVNVAIADAETEDYRYQFRLRGERLLRLCATWRKYMPTAASGDTPWGPSEAELLAVLMQKGKARRGEDAYPEEGDSDGELEDFDTLDALETADMYRDPYGADSDSSSDSE